MNSTPKLDILSEFNKVISFWPVFLVSFILSMIFLFAYIRYTDEIYDTSAKILVLDDAQDSEMALPTAMTIFNRSMINLENDIAVLKSHRLNSLAISSLKSNVSYYTKGLVRTIQKHPDNFYEDYEIVMKFDTDTIQNSKLYELEIVDNNLKVSEYNDENELTYQKQFPKLSTLISSHQLPFDLKINKYDSNDNFNRLIKFSSFEKTVKNHINEISVEEFGKESDILQINLKSNNPLIAQEYINTLIDFFDSDGIYDRQNEYKRTIDFVDSRSIILQQELEKIELNKEFYKKKNDISELSVDASISLNKRTNFESELFDFQTQKDLAQLLKDFISDSSFDLMPINVGFDNDAINDLISKYNDLVNERDKLLYSGAGKNNNLLIAIEKSIRDFSTNIIISIDNHLSLLDKTINNLSFRENEISSEYNNIPENEKILRSIERELEIKEALYLLLLQKREEAQINFAVTKPSIKVIDYSITGTFPVSPNKPLLLIFFTSLSFIIPYGILSILLFFDNKIYDTDELIAKTNGSVIAEIPFIQESDELYKISGSYDRTMLAEGIRMLASNLKYILTKSDNLAKVILITSSVKGEGKTIVSVNTSSLLKSDSKRVLLIGSDLRNPQLHRYLGIKKSDAKGITNYVYSDDKDWDKYIIKNKHFDLLPSGDIPPNPTEILGSKKFKKIISDARNIYDYVVIDSAPCLLVSDTLEISGLCDKTIIVTRSGFTNNDICEFIKKSIETNRFNNISLVLNAVGKRSLYGYNYKYSYGYKYSYNYGYNYGYSESKV